MNRKRTESGLSVVVIVCLSAVIMLWLVSMMAVIMPSYNKVTRGRQMAMLRMDLESSLNWAIAQLEKAPPPFDDTSCDGVPIQVQVPPNIINAGTNVSLSINNVPPAADSGLYVPNLDAKIPANNIAQNGWRVIVATGNRGALNRAMRTVLMPYYGNPSGNQSPIFYYALFGQTGVVLEDGVRTSTYDSATGSPSSAQTGLSSDVRSNGAVSVGSGALIGGDVIASCLNQPLSTNAASLQTLAMVNGVVQSNAAIAVAPSAAVLNKGNNPSGGMQAWRRIPQRVAPPVPPIPADAVSLGSVTVKPGESLLLQPGDYVVHDLTVGANATFGVQPGGVANIYLQNSNSPVAISIHDQAIINAGSIPAALRFWYSGRAGINFGKQTKFTGVIQAPGAKISVGDYSTVNGSLIGSSVQVGSGSIINYDTELRNTGSALLYGEGMKPLSTLQPVLWQEY